MAKLYIREYDKMGQEIGGSMYRVSAPAEPGVANQTPVAIGGATTQSSAFSARTRVIRVHTDVICSVEIGGTNPVATTDSPRMAAGSTEYFCVTPGDKLAVITNV